MLRTLLLGVAMLIGLGLSAPPTQAGYVVTLEQEGSNVVATGSGPIDLTGLSLVVSGAITNASVQSSLGLIITGPVVDTPIDIYTGFTGPTSFGNSPSGVGGLTSASSGSGDIVEIIGEFNNLAVPSGYVSGNPLSDNATYDNQTLASLEATPGVYEWTWGSGPNQNFTLDVVPEPSSLLLLALPLGFLILLATRDRRGTRNALSSARAVIATGCHRMAGHSAVRAGRISGSSEQEAAQRRASDYRLCPHTVADGTRPDTALAWRQCPRKAACRGFRKISLPATAQGIIRHPRRHSRGAAFAYLEPGLVRLCRQFR
jgi:hypothetical protein